MWQSLLCLVLSSCTQYDTDVLRGRQIRVTSIVSPPYLSRRAAADGDDDAGGNVVHYEGYVVDLLNAMEELLGCQFVIKEVADGRYGMSTGEGAVAAGPGGRGGHLQDKWTGMIGEVMRGEADLAVADLRVSPQRILAVDFTQSIMDNGLVAVAGHQEAGRSVEELAAKADLTFLVVEGGSKAKFFQDTVDPTYKKIAEKIRYTTL
jgi:ABC-type amino acid transport substrate-binding protein